MNTHPNPPAGGQPRQDTSRPGPARTVWEARFAWEGARLQAALAALPPATGPLTVLAYASESPEMRASLQASLAQALRERGEAATVRVRSAYKSGYFWVAEEVRPLWRRHRADALSVRYPLLDAHSPGRFLQELYPLAALLEREGVRAVFQPGGPEARYEATLSRGDEALWRGHCFIPLHPRTSPDGREVLAPTGWLRVEGGAGLLHDARCATDGECVWDWYTQQVLPRLLALADARPGLPVFRSLSATVQLSEPDVALGVLEERASMTEALEEELYFGTLDALKRHTGTPGHARSLRPGSIRPVAHATPGQDSRVRVVLTPWGEVQEPPETTAPAATLRAELEKGQPPAHQDDRPWSPAAIWASARAQAQRYGLEWAVPAHSVQGLPVPAVLRPGTAPQGGVRQGGVLVTGGQHANEATGPVAAVQLIGQLAARALPFAVLPLENPDGASLHRALCQINPEHMHHAARYTALGDDLESRVREGKPRWESRARVWAAEQVSATLHLNLHGYPAHEWVRPYSGYAPFGFESWALPAGFLTIVWYHPGRAHDARKLAESMAERLMQLRDVAEHAARAARTSAAHSGRPHYELIHGLPFLLAEQPAALCPLTVITEAPDETIYGEHFSMFVRAHLTVCEAALDHHL